MKYTVKHGLNLLGILQMGETFRLVPMTIRRSASDLSPSYATSKEFEIFSKKKVMSGCEGKKI